MAFHASLATLLSLSLAGSSLTLQPDVSDFGGEPAEEPEAEVAEAEAGPETMSDEEKIEKAKELFAAGDAAFNAGSFEEALGKFEEAYNVYAPNIHVFNFNIGMAAYEAGDCIKSKKALQRFLDLVPEHPARGDAQQRLIDIERSECAKKQEEAAAAAAAAATEPAPVATTTLPVTDDDDAPMLTSKKSEREEAAERERRRKAAKKRPMLIAGGVLTGLGVGALVGGGVSVALANQKANELAELASPGPTGFPSGNYADEEVFDLDRNALPANNIATWVLFSAGGALFATGLSLIIVDVVQKKRGKGRYAVTNPRNLAVSPAPLPSGGGATASFSF